MTPDRMGENVARPASDAVVGPPMRNGLRASRIRIDRELIERATGDHGPSPSVLAVLTTRFPADARRLREKAADGEIFDDAGAPLPADLPARVNSFVHVFRDPPEEQGEAPMPVILYRDNDILVVDKPHGLATMPRGRHVRHSALVQLRLLTGEDDLAPAHRLDRLTAGVLVFTRHRHARRDFQMLFQERRARKEYLAVAEPPDGDWDHMTRRTRIIKPPTGLQCLETPGEVNAETEIAIVHRGNPSVYRLRPTTGRTHQLRVHMNALGVPILMDPLYPQVLAPTDIAGPPLQLLASSIEFEHPTRGATMRFESRSVLALDPRG